MIRLRPLELVSSLKKCVFFENLIQEDHARVGRLDVGEKKGQMPIVRPRTKINIRAVCMNRGQLDCADFCHNKESV